MKRYLQFTFFIVGIGVFQISCSELHQNNRGEYINITPFHSKLAGGWTWINPNPNPRSNNSDEVTVTISGSGKISTRGNCNTHYDIITSLTENLITIKSKGKTMMGCRNGDIASGFSGRLNQVHAYELDSKVLTLFWKYSNRSGELVLFR